MLTYALRLIPISLAFAAAVTSASAQQPGSRQTRDFVQAAAQSDQFEILEAYTALAQSNNPHVRVFARQMIQAHGRTSADLRKAAARAGLEQPKPGLSSDQSAFLAALQSQRGGDFDRTYARQQTLAHRAALVIERAYAVSGDDPLMRQEAAATVPIISSHLQMADQMRSSMGGS